MEGGRASEMRGADSAIAVLAAAASHDEAAAGVLEGLAQRFNGAYAVLWSVDEPAGMLRWTADHVAVRAVEGYAYNCRRLTFPPGAGLPGRVWSSSEPQWITDVLAPETRFARSQAAAEAGLATVVAVPVHSRTSLLGVLELYTADPWSRDEEALAHIRSAARMLGEWLGASRHDERLAVSEALRAAMVNAALDCIITIDGASRVLDFNPAAERTFGRTREEAIGADLAELVIPPELRGAHHSAVGRLLAGGEPKLLDTRFELEAMRSDGSRFPIELSITRLQAPEGPLFVGFVRDITERRRAQEELTLLLERETAERRRAELAEQQSQRIAHTLQRSLLPPVLPDVPGFDVAAGFHSGGSGVDVGGDFYDLFQTAPGVWSWAIGDVCGKGAEAAALTGLARHTIRAAAMQRDDPRAVLALLNLALRRERAGGLLTAALGRLELGDGATRVRVANGGHPPPLVVRRDGRVERLEPTGTMLGAVDEPWLGDTSTTLEPGDVLVAYTDGVIEARRPHGGRLEIEGLEATLRQCRDAPVAEMGAAIEAAAAPGGRVPTDDDVAYLLLRLRD